MFHFAAKEFEHKETWGVFGARCDRKTEQNHTREIISDPKMECLKHRPHNKKEEKKVLLYNRNPHKTPHTRSVLYGYT